MGIIPSNIDIAPDPDREANEASDYVRAATRLFLAGRDGVAVMIQVFLDESGTHQDSKHITVAAAWGTADDWSRWTFNWMKAKHPVRVHHSTECHNYKGEYKSWNEIQHALYVQRILGVARETFIQGRVAAIHKRMFYAKLAHRPDVKAWLNDTYLICLQWALRRVWEHLDANGVRDVAFIHEQNEYQNSALDIFRIVQENFPHIPATFTFAPKGRYVPLQYADLLAFEGNKQVQNTTRARKPLESIDPRGDRISFMNLDGVGLTNAVDELIRGYDALRA